MIDRDELLAAVQKVFKNSKECSVDDLSKACRFCATDESCLNIIEDDEVNLSNASKSLLEIALEGRADDDPEDHPTDIRRGRLALRTFINAANRSEKLRSAVDPSCAILWRALIRIPDFYVEACASLVSVAKEFHTACALSSDYSLLLNDLALLWEKLEDRSWLSAFFSIHLEKDYAFLSHCFAEFSTQSFCALLRITETLVDSSEHNIVLQIHENNVSFCVALLERIMFDMGEGDKELDIPTLLECLIYASDTIGSVALLSSCNGGLLLSNTTAVEVLVDILHSVLDAQAVYERKKSDTFVKPSYPDRPEKEVPTRLAKVTESKTMLGLSNALQANDMALLGNLKCAAVRAIGNLCCDSQKNRVAAGARGGVIVILGCTRLSSFDKPFIMQWSIAALRHLCVESIENQEILLSIEQKPCGIIDRDKLFKELGISVEVDEEGKTRIKQVRR